MKDIQELIDLDDRYRNCIVQQRFPSKKNTVSLVTYTGKPCVFKWFAPGFRKNMKKEEELLSTIPSSLNVPQILEKDEKNHLLILNYLSGQNLCDHINDPKVSMSTKLEKMTQLAQWFASFHTHFKTEGTTRLHGDAGIRNFIINTQCWGVDFEETRQGPPVEDIAECTASILSSNPMFTSEKYHLCIKLVNEYLRLSPQTLNNLSQEIAYALVKKIPYRPADEHLLKGHAEKIKTQCFTI